MGEFTIITTLSALYSYIYHTFPLVFILSIMLHTFVKQIIS